MNFKKTKKFWAILFAITLIVPSILNHMEYSIPIHAAEETLASFNFTYGDNKTTWVATATMQDSICIPTISLNTLPTDNGNCTIKYPSFQDVKCAMPNTSAWKNLTFNNTLQLDTADKSDFSKVYELNIPDGYSKIPVDLFKNNSSIQNLKITAQNTDIVLDEYCFANMSNLKEVNINAKSLTFKGSVFYNCKSLANVSICGNTIFDGQGYNFAECPALSELTFKGDSVNFKSTVSEFNGSTFSSSNSAMVLFECPVHSENKVFDFTSHTETVIKSISLSGYDNNIGANFLYQTNVGAFNVESKTTFKSRALSGNKLSTINKLSINAATTFENQALYQEQITKMYFNIDNTTKDNIKVLPSENPDIPVGLGYLTKVNNLYFNYENFLKEKEVTSSLKNIALGNTDSTSLNCDAIYFLNPNFNCIENSDYTRCNGGTTEVYAYGGAVTKDKGSSFDLFQKWLQSSHCHFNNCVYGAENASYTVYHSNIFLKSDATTYRYDFSSTDNIKVTSTYFKPSIVSDFIDTKFEEDEEYILPMSYGDMLSEGTNFSYRILQKSTTATADTPYSYYYNGSYYVPLDTPYCDLTAGNHTFILEFGGRKFPFTLSVGNRFVREITSVESASGSSICLNYGETVTKDMLKVNVTYTDGTTGILHSSEYELEDAQVTAANHTVFVKTYASGNAAKMGSINVKGIVLESIHSITPVSGGSLELTYGEKVTKDMLIVKATYTNCTDPVVISPEDYDLDEITISAEKTLVKVTISKGCPKPISDTMIVYGYPDAVTSFTAHYPSELPIGSVLNVKDVYLTDVTYANPSKHCTSPIYSGFYFVVNGEQTEEVTIKGNNNSFAIVYENFKKTDAVSIIGTSGEITKVSAYYLGNGVYEGQQLKISPSTISIYLYRENSTEAIPLEDYTDVSLGDYEIVAGVDNEIDVYFNGMKASSPIKVPGLKDIVSEITKVSYSGPCDIGTKLQLSDFYIQLTMISGATLDSVSNPEMLNSITLSNDTLRASYNVITVSFNNTLKKSITILGSGFVPVATNTPNPITETPSVSTEAPNYSTDIPDLPVETPPFISASTGPEVTTAPPVATSEATSSPMVQSTNTPEATPVSTSSVVEMNTDVPNTSTEPAETKQLRAGSTFTSKSVTYKVLSNTDAKKTVSIQSYHSGSDTPVIRNTIAYENDTFQVVSIQKGAFKNCSALKGKLTIPKNITVIGAEAFSGCKNLTSVTFSANTKIIGSKAFYNCKKLKFVDFYSNKKLTKVGSGAFKKNAKKRKFKIKQNKAKYYISLLKGTY